MGFFSGSFKYKAGLVLLILGKILGIVGVCLGFSNIIGLNNLRYAGGIMLALAIVMIIVSAILCVLDMKEQQKKEDEFNEHINRMLNDGSLKEKLAKAGFKVIENRNANEEVVNTVSDIDKLRMRHSYKASI